MSADTLPLRETIAPRLAARIAAFTGISIALHALMLSVAVPGGGVDPAPRASPPLLHAVLAPLDSPQSSPSGEAAAGAAETTPSANPASAAAADGVPLPDKWYTASELTTLAQPLILPTLHYPAELAGSGVAARMRLKLFIDEHGTIRKIEVVRRGPHPAFDAAAAAGWEEVRFTPATKDGVAVKSQKLLEFEFQPN